MNTTTAPTGLNQTVAESELDTITTAALTAADTTTATRIQTLSLVHQARISQFNRTVTSLTELHGANSTQVLAAKAAVAAAKNVVARVEIVRGQTTATPPTVAAVGWAVWGHVYDSTTKPLSGFCVFLVDEEKNYQKDYGFAFTDSAGLFTINYPGTPGTKTPAAIPKVFLAVTNAKAELVSLGTAALSLTVGSAFYIDTQLAAGEPVIGELPQEIRKVALPPAGKAK